MAHRHLTNFLFRPRAARPPERYANRDSVGSPGTELEFAL